MKVSVLLLLVFSTFIQYCEGPECQCDDLVRSNSELREELDQYKGIVASLTQNLQKLANATSKIQRDLHHLKCKVYGDTCPKRFQSIGHSCYRIVRRQHKSRSEAKMFCKRRHNSHLVALNTNQEKERLVVYLHKTGKNGDAMEFHTSGVIEKGLKQGTGITSSRWVWKPRRNPKTIRLPINPVNRESQVKDSIEQCLVLKLENRGILVPDYCKRIIAFICELPKCSKFARRGKK